MQRRQTNGDDFVDRPNPSAADGVSQPVNAVVARLDAAVGKDGTDGNAASRPDAAVTPNDFDALFEQHYERLVRALTLVAGDREAAADAVQEAFVKAHLRWRRLRDYDDPAGWVRRVAINRLHDEHRRTGRKRRMLDRLRGRSPATSEQPDIDEFDRLLAALPRQQRISTALFYVDGMTIREIAAAISVSEGTVKSHLHDARRTLRPILEREHQHG